MIPTKPGQYERWWLEHEKLKGACIFARNLSDYDGREGDALRISRMGFFNELFDRKFARLCDCAERMEEILRGLHAYYLAGSDHVSAHENTGSREECQQCQWTDAIGNILSETDEKGEGA